MSTQHLALPIRNVFFDRPEGVDVVTRRWKLYTVGDATFGTNATKQRHLMGGAVQLTPSIVHLEM